MTHCVATADLVWWDGLTSVDQNLQANINKLVVAAEGIKLSEVDAWADASRQKTEQLDDSPSDTALVWGKTVIQLWEGAGLALAQ